MALVPSTRGASSASAARLARRRRQYRYRPRQDNTLQPIAVAERWPWLREQYGPAWALGVLPRAAGALARYALHRTRFALQRASFRFDTMKAYDQLHFGALPDFAREADRDEVFAWWRVAGANPLLLRQERDLPALRRRIGLDVAGIEAWLRHRGREVALAREAGAGRLFAVDFRLLQSALRPDTRTRDSRWREKYLPAPVGVFLEAPGLVAGFDLVPLALQVDPPQGAPEEPDRVFHPWDRWGWKLARTYFEVADVTWHAAAGHLFGTHFAMEPFCLATPRQLPEDHPVFQLLRPHTRHTLPANRAAYRYFNDRRKIYAAFYSGTLEETRQVAVQRYLERSFRELAVEADLAHRGVASQPAVYPYRDDARLWLGPLRRFAESAVAAFHPDDAAVRDDAHLQAWAAELMDPERGAVRELVPGGRLDTRDALAGLLAQVLFIAGPGHASQHFSTNRFYRYAPAFPSGAWAPPPWRYGEASYARWALTLPPPPVAARQLFFNTFSEYRFDRFGHYDRYPLGHRPEMREPIARLQADLAEVERAIDDRNRGRPFAYDFLLPSRVPNSVNI